ncbi:MAG TPA: hypothetical protein VHR86_08000 [Armatimonadota bacterium]|nr:hypothetical protein [Armatimonadota bacterium]
MKGQSASDFQLQNSRRLWRSVGFLITLLLVALLLGSYLLVFVARGGGPDFFSHYQLVGECASKHMMPLASAIDRYHRDTDRYPDRLEQLYPDYLSSKAPLYCPADPSARNNSTSYEYYPPRPGGRSFPEFRCNHHGSAILCLKAQGVQDDGTLRWVVRVLQPRSGVQPP